MRNEFDIKELHEGVKRHAAVVNETKMLADISFNFIENNIEGAELVITSGFEIGCAYSIELAFDNFSFTIFDGFVGDVAKMVNDTKELLVAKKLRLQIINFQNQDTNQDVADAWKYNFKLCTGEIIF
jgi:hypothetical protein